MSRRTLIIIVVVAVSLVTGLAVWRLGQPRPLIEELPPEGEIKLSCLVLDEAYCDKGKPIYDEENKLIGLGFNLPTGTKIYTPVDGMIDNSFMTKILDGVYYGFWIQEGQNYFSVVGETETVIKPEHPAFPEDPERLANDPVQKGQLVAQTTEDQKRRIITPAGNYDIVIDFTTYDATQNLWSHNIGLFQQLFPYVQE